MLLRQKGITDKDSPIRCKSAEFTKINTNVKATENIIDLFEI